MTASAIERLRELRSKATGGLWGTRFGYNYADDVWIASDADRPWQQHMGVKVWVRQMNAGDYAVDSKERRQCEADAAAIVAAMNALPALLECAEALQGLHDDTVEYVTLNKLHDADGSPAINNHWMKQARAALDALAKEVG